MLVHPKKKSIYSIQVPLTSLIDIVFLLLIYFLLTSSFMDQEGIIVNLPKADAKDLNVKREVIVYIENNGKIFFNGNYISLKELSLKLKKDKSFKLESVIIKADRELELEKVVSVMDIIQKSGCKKIVLATERN